jgi:hypothetical protein
MFLYDENVCPGKIISFNEENVYISAVVTSLNSWKRPEKPCILEYEWNDALGGINPPKLVSKRGFYTTPELSTLFEFGLSVRQLAGYSVIKNTITHY